MLRSFLGFVSGSSDHSRHSRLLKPNKLRITFYSFIQAHQSWCLKDSPVLGLDKPLTFVACSMLPALKSLRVVVRYWWIELKLSSSLCPWFHMWPFYLSVISSSKLSLTLITTSQFLVRLSPILVKSSAHQDPFALVQSIKSRLSLNKRTTVLSFRLPFCLFWRHSREVTLVALFVMSPKRKREPEVPDTEPELDRKILVAVDL